MSQNFPELTAIATLIILLVVVIIGGIVTITHSGTLSFDHYVRDVGVAAGLLAVGRGLDSRSRV